MNARPRIDNRQAGISLLETLIYIAVLAVVFELALAAFYRAWDNSRHLSQNATDIVRVLQAGERWRDDVRSASGQVKLVDSNGESILQIPKSTGAVQYVLRGNTLWRQASGKDPWVRFLEDVKTSRMQLDQRQNAAAWAWELELRGKQRTARVRPLFNFYAPARIGRRQ